MKGESQTHGIIVILHRFGGASVEAHNYLQVRDPLRASPGRFLDTNIGEETTQKKSLHFITLEDDEQLRSLKGTKVVAPVQDCLAILGLDFVNELRIPAALGEETIHGRVGMRVEIRILETNTSLHDNWTVNDESASIAATVFF